MLGQFSEPTEYTFNFKRQYKHMRQKILFLGNLPFCQTNLTIRLTFNSHKCLKLICSSCSTTLGNLSNSPSACFVASDGESLRVYQAVIDARTLLAEVSSSERRSRLMVSQQMQMWPFLNYCVRYLVERRAFVKISSCRTGGWRSSQGKSHMNSCNENTKNNKLHE